MNRGEWPRRGFDVLADEADDNFFFLSLRFSLVRYRRLDLADFNDAADNAILLWTPHARQVVLADSQLINAATTRAFMLLPRRGTALPPELAHLRVLEWTNAADVYWQWRVANGAPVDHVDRPKH